MSTALADAFDRAGLDTAEDELYALAVDVLRSVGIDHIGRATAVLRDRAGDIPRLQREVWRQFILQVRADMRGDELREEGQIDPAAKANANVPSASQPHDDWNGHIGRADRKAVPKLPDQSSPNSSGEDHCVHVDETTIRVSSSAASSSEGEDQTVIADEAKGRVSSPIAPLYSEPSDLYLRASLKAERRAALTIFDTLKIDERAIGDWTMGECSGAATTHLRNGHILLAISRHARNADPRKTVRESLSVEALQQIVQTAAENVDAL